MLSLTQATASSFNDALNIAIDKALGSYSGRIIPTIDWKIVRIQGQSGGSAGAHCDLVSIQIEHKLSREYLETQAHELDAELAA